VSLALIVPELGALAMASLLALAPVRLGMKALIGAAVLYTLFLSMASMRSHEAEALLIALGLAGMASAALSTTSQARLQRLVPAEMRGRVFAL
jgi:MFS-type transporter involved in bile tolerance (Atg22 family)